MKVQIVQQTVVVEENKVQIKKSVGEQTFFYWLFLLSYIVYDREK